MKKAFAVLLFTAVLIINTALPVTYPYAFDNNSEEFLYGYSLTQAIKTGNITETNYGYGTRIKTPKTDITRIEMIVHVAENADVTCTVRSADLNTVYAEATNFISTDDTRTTFVFTNTEKIVEPEIYICVEAENSVLGNDMIRTVNDGYALNPEIGAAYGNYSNKTVNVYKPSETQWKWRYTSQANRFSLAFYVYCKADEEAVTHHDIYVATTGSDETGDGTEGNPFKTILYANNTITESNYYNQYTIHVADGVYDDLTFTEDTDDNQAILLKHYVTYEGNTENPENCVIYFDGAERTYNHSISADDLTAKKAIFHYVTKDIATLLGIKTTVRGFKLSGKNIRYFIHLDTSGRGVRGDYTFSDLIINHMGCPYINDTNMHYPIGCGVAQNEKVLFKNVTFENEQVWKNGNSYNVSYYAHNNEDNQTQLKENNLPAEVTFYNCELNNAEMQLSSISSGYKVNYRFICCNNIGTINRYSDEAKLDMRVYIDGKIICELHVPVDNEPIAPTCTEYGQTGGTHCSLCNMIIEPSELTAPYGHNEVIDETIAPTCTEEGKTQGIHCSICNTTIKKQEVIEAKGHIITIVPAIPATFKKEGKTQGSYCSVCGEIIIPQQTIKKLGAPSLSKVKAGKKKCMARFNAVKAVDGYQLQYSVKKNMKSGKKKNVKANKTKLTVKKLKSGKKYYVRIRAYKTINGKKVYSKWSKKIKVKIK